MIPIATKQYWYASAYMGLLFLMPWLNKFLRGCSKTECLRLFKSMILFIVYVTCANRVGDCFTLNGGYSLLWLIILYLIGAVTKKCNLAKDLKIKKLIVGIIGCILLNWSAEVFIPEYTISISNMLNNYTSITVSYVAFAFVIIFLKLKLSRKKERIIAYFSPAVFGVYLIHTQPVIWKYLMKNAFTWVADFNVVIIPFVILMCAISVFCICIFVEKIRLLIFSFLKIDENVWKIMDNIGKR